MSDLERFEQFKKDFEKCLEQDRNIIETQIEIMKKQQSVIDEQRLMIETLEGDDRRKMDCFTKATSILFNYDDNPIEERVEHVREVFKEWLDTEKKIVGGGR